MVARIREKMEKKKKSLRLSNEPNESSVVEAGRKRNVAKLEKERGRGEREIERLNFISSSKKKRE